MSIKSYFDNGKRLYEVHVKARDCLGRQLNRKRSRIANQVAAKKVEFELKKDLEIITKKRTNWTWGEWHKECLSQMSLTLKEGTILNYGRCLKSWLDPAWNLKVLSDFSKSDVHEFIHEFLLDRGATSNIQRHTLKKVSRIFEMAVEEGILNKNPARGLKVSVSKPRQLVLTAIEAETLLRKSKEINHRFFPVWAFALFTGMRSGEMYALRWTDVDLEAGIISVNKQFTSKDGLSDTKTRENRVVPISAELHVLLSELKLKGGYREKLWSWGDRRIREKKPIILTDLVLPRIREWRSGEQADVLKDFCRGISITPVKFHDLRATFITNLLAQGTPLVTVMAIVGHRKMSTTDVYLRLAGVSVKDATERLGYRMPFEAKDNVVNLFQQGK